MAEAGKVLIVIGGGAAGFFCAVNAARLHPGLQVRILEKTSKLLSKVKVSGGGRCNVTHNAPAVPDLVKKYPRGQQMLKKSFYHFHTLDTVAWFAERGVTLKAEGDGRMFPVTDSSQTVIDCLLEEATKYRVRIDVNTEVTALHQLTDGRWRLDLRGDKSIEANYVCVCTGGYPQADKFNWLKELGHEIQPPVPSLFTFNMPGNPVTQLMGVSVPQAVVKVAGTKLQESGPLLITHWGMSGPVILRLSAWGARSLHDMDYRFTAIVNWLPDYQEHTLREEWPEIRQGMAGQKIYQKNYFALPQRLWHFLLQQSGVAEDTRWADLPAKEQNRLIRNLVSMEFPVQGKTTFKEEFVTCGGIALSQVDAQTMESRLHKGLFFAGEVMDVDGITGGFNFQHAWTSGWLVANSLG
ncbi:NAD(P)/FAD-dependent oxidoreductase [Chitinophaga horti]|uniref:NAD(P)/FAD-dependent oxidoreductase n=1 Tax=Chitinophaga horti TaxID=2920382 RepID=A0ABY6IUJ8_9BACT|nr:NAD(P)/FAD-dependent oxidoreductase [Chitinophaga horti]UYQ91043.1 NAD(P)/FAD-dependent oxidoreductase [Chitinophaga horti]